MYTQVDKLKENSAKDLRCKNNARELTLKRKQKVDSSRSKAVAQRVFMHVDEPAESVEASTIKKIIRESLPNKKPLAESLNGFIDRIAKDSVDHVVYANGKDALSEIKKLIRKKYGVGSEELTALDEYTAGDYKVINPQLRSGKLDKDTENKVKKINNVVTTGPKSVAKHLRRVLYFKSVKEYNQFAEAASSKKINDNIKADFTPFETMEKIANENSEDKMNQKYHIYKTKQFESMTEGAVPTNTSTGSITVMVNTYSPPVKQDHIVDKLGLAVDLVTDNTLFEQEVLFSPATEFYITRPLVQIVDTGGSTPTRTESMSMIVKRNYELSKK